MDRKPKNHHDYSFPQYPVKSVIYNIYCGNLLLFSIQSLMFLCIFIEFKYLRVCMIFMHRYQRKINALQSYQLLSGVQNMLIEI